MIKTKRNFTEGPMFFKIILFAVPIILTGILQLCYNMADNIIVGRFSGDTDAVAAVGSTGSITALIVNLLLGVGSGAGVVVAQEFGAKNDDNVSRIVHTSMTFAAIGGVVVMMISLILARPALELIGIQDALIDKSTLYMRIISLGIPASAIYNFASAILRSVGDSKTPLIILSTTGLVNVGLNLVFVLFFHMTVDGVAYATIASQYLSAIVVMLVLMRAKGRPYGFSVKKMGINKIMLKRALRQGIPAGIQSMMFNISNTLLMGSMHTFDKTVVTAYTIANNIDAIAYHICASFGIAAMTFTAQNFGAGKIKRVDRVFVMTLLQVAIIGFIAGQVIIFFGESLATLFIDANDPNRTVILSQVMSIITMILSAYFLLGIMETISGALRGLGCSIIQMTLYISGICASRLFWIYVIFPLESFHTPLRLMLCYPISWIVTSICLFIARIIMRRKISKRYDNIIGEDSAV